MHTQKRSSASLSSSLSSLSLLNIEYDNVLSCITDGAAYMGKAVHSLQVLSPENDTRELCGL